MKSISRDQSHSPIDDGKGERNSKKDHSITPTSRHDRSSTPKDFGKDHYCTKSKSRDRSYDGRNESCREDRSLTPKTKRGKSVTPKQHSEYSTEGERTTATHSRSYYGSDKNLPHSLLRPDGRNHYSRDSTPNPKERDYRNTDGHHASKDMMSFEKKITLTKLLGKKDSVENQVIRIKAMKVMI